jgi:magnesium transporter
MNQESQTSIDLDASILSYVNASYTAIRVDDTVGDVLARLRTEKPTGKIIYFYVLDKDRRLVGVVPTRRLLLSALEEKVASIMVSRVVAIPSAATVMTALEQFLMHRFLAFPVVDEEGRMLGTVDIDQFTQEMFEIAEESSVDDIFSLIGVRLHLGKKVSPWHMFADRFPWLISNIVGGLFCAYIAYHYQGVLSTAIALALYMPVVLALAESVSIQSVTITLQGLHPARRERSFFSMAVGRESITAMLLGAGCALVVGGVVYFWQANPPLAASIGLSILLSVAAACLMGVIVPTLLHALRRDPRIAAGPITLALADVATLVCYFNLARTLLM